MTTGLILSVEQIIEYYSARWEIESGFKEIKQEIGSSKSQTRNADAVINHLNFRSLRLPAFSDVRRIIAEAALDEDFQSICPVPRQSPQKSFVKTLLRMVG